MTTVVFPAFDELALAERLAERLDAIAGVVESRRFPDEETYLRLLTPVADREVILVGSLDRLDPKLARDPPPAPRRLRALAHAGARSGRWLLTKINGACDGRARMERALKGRVERVCAAGG